MQKIPLSRPAMTEEMVKAAADALSGERLVMGESVFKFEEEFARFIGTDHAVAVSSGTMALQLAQLAAKVAGREVITTPLSFIATANSIVHAGGRPVFADVRMDDYNIDPEKVKMACGPSTRAILPVHLFGNPCDMDPLLEECRKHDLILIEDAAQAHGAVYKGKKVGSIGDLGCFSFYPTKNMTVGGDGGMVTTDSDKMAKAVAKLRDCGRISRYVHDEIGYTARLNTVNAAIGRIQLKYLEGWNERRTEIAGLYAKALKGIKRLRLPPPPSKEVVPVFHIFACRAERRDELQSFLGGNGIETGVHYPVPIHLQPAYKKEYSYEEGSFPCSERLSKELISLPMFPDLKDAQVSWIASKILAFYDE